MDAFGGGAGGPPPAAPPLPPPAPNRLDAGLLNLLTGGVGAPPGMMGMGMGPGPPPGPGGGRGGATPGAGLFGAAQGGMMGPGGMPVGITMHQHQGLGGTAPTHPQQQRPGFGGQGLGPAGAGAGGFDARFPGGGADVGPPAFFAGSDVSGGDALARAIDRVQIEPPNEPGQRGERRRGGGPPGFARRPETRAANGGGAPNGLDALPHAGHASLPSPNGSPVGGGEEPVGGGKSRRGRGRFGADGRGARGGKSAKSNGGGGKGDQPGAGPKTLPKPRIAPQTQ